MNNENTIQLFEGNCLDLLPKIADKSVKAVVTDPPYMSVMQHNGSISDYSDVENLRPFFRGVLKELSRVLSEDGSLYWFCDWRTYPFYFSVVSEFLDVKNMIVWNKHRGQGPYYAPAHELIIFCTLDRKFRNSKTNVITDVAGFNSGAQYKDGPKVHPTQKPTALIERLITDSTNEGDTVLDCFMGSGTTGVSAKRTGRRFIGIELQHKYFEAAKGRIFELPEDR